MTDILAALAEFCESSLLDRVTAAEAETDFMRRAHSRLEQMSTDARALFNVPNLDELMTHEDHVEDALKYFSKLVGDTAWLPVAVELLPSADPKAELQRWQKTGYLAHSAPLLDGGESGLLFARDGFLILRVPPHQTGRYLQPFLKSKQVQRLHDPQRKFSIPTPRRSTFTPSMVESGQMVYDGALPPGFDRQTAGNGVRVAVIDSGIDHMHPELEGKVVAFKDFTDEGRGDLCGHGSHCAGTIAAQNTGNHGVLGISPGAELIDAKIFDESGTGNTMSIAAAVRWAADNGAKVISMSLGGGHQTDGSSLLSRVCENVAIEQDVVIVIAAGNDGQAGSISIPGDTPSALTVGAIDKNGELADFSSRGPTLDESVTGSKPNLVAPGVEIVSVSSGQRENGFDYEASDGTSMACPHVAGAAAALWSYAPNLSAKQVRQLLEDTCSPINGSLHEVGRGLVNVPDALAKSKGMARAGLPALPKIGKGTKNALFLLTPALLAWFLWPSSNPNSEETVPLISAPPIAMEVPAPSEPDQPVHEEDPSVITPGNSPSASFRSNRRAELTRPTSRPDVCSKQPRCFCLWKDENVLERRVQPGETLNQWSELFSIDRSELAAWNGIESTANIATGDKLLVSTKGLEIQTHRIRRGDVAGVLAEKRGVSVTELAKQNCLSNLDKIYKGQPLLLIKNER